MIQHIWSHLTNTCIVQRRERCVFHAPTFSCVPGAKVLKTCWIQLIDVLFFIQFLWNTFMVVCSCLSHIRFCLKLFKLPLEKEGQVGGPILAQEEMKTIFGSIPDIYEVHTRIKVVCPRPFQSKVWLELLLLWFHFGEECVDLVCVCVCDGLFIRVTWRSFLQTGQRTGV